MSKRTRPSIPGTDFKVPRKTWRELRSLFGSTKKAKAFVKTLK